ncbi:MAG: cyclopropane-fatty-acyl-phospholipid synthase family protein [Gammaproteobacteria bacterium]|nr:MAG: cyclopropane-fatty-acyl-phospholipid synthase family protein [Gammaproteobacteria bacterium]
MTMSEHADPACNESVAGGSATDDGRSHSALRAKPATRSIDAVLLRRLLAAVGHPPVAFELWNGERIGGEDTPAVATLRLADRATLLRLLWYPNFNFAEGYSEGRIGFQGDLIDFLVTMTRSALKAPQSLYSLRNRLRRVHGSSNNTPRRSQENVHHHYDLGNDFYALWLGPTMAYTCAYYPSPETTLDQAQVAKMDLVCRKLRLAPGESVVEAGCGWGTLALHMARKYGVRVRAFNISREQIAWARERARAAGMDRQVQYIEDDYRNIRGHYDAFVSVGMLEHVGPDHYRGLGRIARDVLGGRGRGLIHSIGRNQPKPFDAWATRRIFPGAYPPSLREMMEIFEPWNLSVLDVENLRLHYARTLRDWLAQFENARDEVEAMFDERFVRMWRLYLAGSTAAFTTGSLQLFQILFAPGESNAVPLTRAEIYRD